MKHPDDPELTEIQRPGSGLTRRAFLSAGAAAAAAVVLPREIVAAPTAGAELPSPANSPTIRVGFTVNGQPRELMVDPRTTLLDALREHLHLTGSKKGCDHGQCGACTVIVGGRRINSCLTLAAMQNGAEITTIEGLGTPQHLHPLQSAFIKCDGFQCGYCTAGQICSAVAMLDEVEAGIPSHVTGDLAAKPELSEEELRERMSGNICRCGAYSNIVEAIQDAAGRNP